MTSKNLLRALGAFAAFGLFGTMTEAAPMLPTIGEAPAAGQTATFQSVGYRGGHAFRGFRRGFGGDWLFGRPRHGGGHGGGGYGGGHRR